MRVAAIDCGTNSIRLLVTDLDVAPGPDGRPRVGSATDVLRRMEIVRLGQDVDRTGLLAPEALERTFAALADYRSQIDALGASAVRMVATSATRDASNREEFVRGVTEILGVPPEVVTGDTEAALSFEGATRDVAAVAPGPYLVVDIGGGSTEFVLGTERPDATWSANVGCVRMTERHLHGDPPTVAQVAAAQSDIDTAVEGARAHVDLGASRTLVGVAGTVTTVVAIALGLQSYDPERIHLARISAADVRAVTTQLLAMPRAERAALPVMHPGRVDVIGAGALVLQRVVAAVGATDLVASEHDILDGIAYSLVGARGGA